MYGKILKNAIGWRSIFLAMTMYDNKNAHIIMRYVMVKFQKDLLTSVLKDFLSCEQAAT